MNAETASLLRVSRRTKVTDPCRYLSTFFFKSRKKDKLVSELQGRKVGFGILVHIFFRFYLGAQKSSSHSKSRNKLRLEVGPCSISLAPTSILRHTPLSSQWSHNLRSLLTDQRYSTRGIIYFIHKSTYNYKAYVLQVSRYFESTENL